MAKNFVSEEFEDCLKKGRIKKFAGAKSLVGKEVKAAQNDFAIAQESFDKSQYKWATIQAYYSMFHAARALIYSQGYREHSHYCLTAAVKALFVVPRVLSIELVEALQLAKTLRENADYKDEFSKESAQALLDKSQQWLKQAEQILSSRSN